MQSRNWVWFAIRACFWGFCALGATGALAQAVSATFGEDWEGYNKGLNGQRYSPLNQINAANVGEVVEVCRVLIAPRASLQSGPVVIGPLMYVTTATDTVAIDPVTCKEKWRHVYRRSEAPGLSVNRGVAYLNDRVFRGTDDARLLALDANTGEEIWSSVVGDPSIGEYVNAAPIAWNGLVIAGLSGGDFGIRGRLFAFDALTGREVWRFNTVPTEREFGADTWKDTKWAEHGGGATWSSFALDAMTGEVFAPVGNPVPGFAPTDRPGANLFTDSVLGLDARTGALRWWYQLQPNDGFDYDLAAAPLLFRNKRGESLLAAAGKDGLLYVVDRGSRQVRFKTPVTTVDNPHAKPSTAGVKSCPGPAGGVLWNGPALDPRRQTIFVGANDMCVIIASQPGSQYVPHGLNLGGSGRPGGSTAAATGWLTAVDAETGAIRWKYHADAPVLGGVTPTAGGIVMTGDNAGNFLVFDSDSGKLLRKDSTGGAIAGGVVTYARSGRQYVAFTSGNISPTGLGAVGRPTIIVMALPAIATPTVSSGTADPSRGRQVYALTCTVCHGAEGDRIAGKSLKAVKSRMNAEQLATFIKTPPPTMPQIFPAPRTPEDERDLRDVSAFVVGWQ